METDFKLYELSDEKLNIILALDQKEEDIYIDTLIEKFYGKIPLDKERYEKLFIGYRASFMLEKLYRTNLIFQEGFSAVYTKTGLIRDMVNDLYYSEDNLIVH